MDIAYNPSMSIENSVHIAASCLDTIVSRLFTEIDGMADMVPSYPLRFKRTLLRTKGIDLCDYTKDTDETGETWFHVTTGSDIFRNSDDLLFLALYGNAKGRHAWINNSGGTITDLIFNGKDGVTIQVSAVRRGQLLVDRSFSEDNPHGTGGAIRVPR